MGIATAALFVALLTPQPAAEDIQAGARFYRAHCRICHGRGGAGDRAPALNRGEFEHASTDEELFEVIQNGIPGTGMWGVGQTERKAWQVVAYLRSLGARGDVPVPGDPQRGEGLFRGAGGCLTCHMVNGQGSALGPDLSSIGRLRSPDALKRSLLEPDEDVERRFWSATVKLAGGRLVSGVLMDDDTFSLRLMDANGNLHGFRKSDIEELAIDRSSTMTSYQGVLSESELTDVVAYLSSLDGRKPR